MNIAATLPLSAWGMVERTPAEIRRSLADGRCVECDMPVKAPGRRRCPALCDGCAARLAWCSSCQRPRPHAAFSRNRANPNGLHSECRECVAARRPRTAPRPMCAARGCKGLAAEGERGQYHKLCSIHLTTHAWCSGCRKAKPRNAWSKAFRDHRRHAGTCQSCDRKRKQPTGRMLAKVDQAMRTYGAIRGYVLAHPDAGRAAIRAALGVSNWQIFAASRALGFTVAGGREHPEVMKRYRTVVKHSIEELMALENLSYQAAKALRRRARAALAAKRRRP